MILNIDLKTFIFQKIFYELIVQCAKEILNKNE